MLNNANYSLTPLLFIFRTEIREIEILTLHLKLEKCTNTEKAFITIEHTWRASFCKSVAPKALMFISLKPSFYWHTAFSSSLVENFSRLFLKITF